MMYNDNLKYVFIFVVLVGLSWTSYGKLFNNEIEDMQDIWLVSITASSVVLWILHKFFTGKDSKKKDD